MGSSELAIAVSLLIGLGTLSLGVYNAKGARRVQSVAEGDSAFRQLKDLYDAQRIHLHECEERSERQAERIDRLEVQVQTLQDTISRWRR